MRFPPSFIERLRSHFLISEVIGRRIAIKKHGREYHALCPFHNEKTPSFTINDEKNFYHCFGCGAHGDTIEFIKLYERLTYPETIEKLAREAGIPLPEFSPEAQKKAEAEKTLLGVLEAACHWFEQQLANVGGEKAREYVKSRGLKPETVGAFRIGFAPDERTRLYQHLRGLGFPQALMAEAGLIIVPDEGGPYDRFRGRVIFPIRNPRGQVIAFGGRLLDGSNKNLPKYLNSPETPLFKKGEMLYNLDLAKRPAREIEMAVVMEGYMDVVSTAQAGIAYAVATLGTAVTAEHLRLLWQLCKEPVICLDGDAAGLRAMHRAAEVALPHLKPGFSLRFALLPSGEDPDTYVQKHGKSSFEKLLGGAQRLSQVLWQSHATRFRLDLPEGRAALEDACRKTAGAIADPTVRQHYASYFKSQLWARTGARQKSGAGKTGQARSALIEHMAVQHHSAALEKLARRMLALLIRWPQLLHKSQIEEALSQLDARTGELDAVRQALLASIDHAGIESAENFAAYLQTQLSTDLTQLEGGQSVPARPPASAEEALRLWNDTADTYQIAHLELELAELQESLGQSMDEADYQRLVELKQALHKAQEGRTFAPPESDVA